MSISYPSIHPLLYIQSTSSRIPECFPLSPVEQFFCRMTMYSRPQTPLPNALRKTFCRMVLLCQIRLTCQSLPYSEPPDVSSSPQSCRAPLPAAGATTRLQRREAVMTRMTPTCCSCRPPRWRHRHSTMALATGPRRRRRPAPPPSASWCGYCCDHPWRSGASCAPPCVQRASSPPRPVSDEDRLLRERRLGRDEVDTLQLRRREHTKINPEKIILGQRANGTCREDGQLTNFSVPALGSIGSIRDGGHE
jgi:hypothetical protein